MSQPLTVSLPPNLYLSGDYVVRVTAIDPTTGDTVAGVTVSDVTMQVDQTQGNPGLLEPQGPFMLVPGPGA